MALFTKTIVSRSASSLLAQLSNAFASGPSFTTNTAVLYTLSTPSSLDSSELSDIVTRLRSIPNSIGCLSSSFGLSVGGQSFGHLDTIICSLAAFDSGRTSLFRSTIPGKEAIQVGRWHAFRKQRGSSISNDVPEDFTSLGAVSQVQPSVEDLPEDLKGIRENPGAIVYLSDNAPEGLSRSLTHFRRTPQLGLVAASTPFVTGRPFTLFHNSDIHSSGAVGISIASLTKNAIIEAEFPGLHPLTDELAITSSEGNLVHTIDNVNPSRLLLAAIQKHNLNLASQASAVFKEDHVYMQIIDGNNHRFSRILSGDPSRGTIALDDIAPAEGTKIRMHYLPIQDWQAQPRLITPTRKSALDFLTLPETNASNITSIPFNSPMAPNEDTVVVDDMFLAGSENGCIVRRANGDNEAAEAPWKAAIPHGLVRMHLE